MKTYSIVALSTAVMILLLAGRVETQLPASTLPRQFHQAIDDYTALHRRLEHDLPPLKPGSGSRQIFEAADELAAALQTARLTAREGDIFGAAIADIFRSRIAKALRAGGYSIEDVVADNEAESPADAPLPVVNGRFPWMRGAGMWPCVLNALPALPEELEYRIVGRDLVLVDVHANLVVDILREALR